MAKQFQGNKYDPYQTHPSTGGGASSAPASWYQPPEAAPLLPGRTQMSMYHVGRVGKWCLLAVVLFPVVYQLYIHGAYCPPDPATRDAIRRDWENDENQHNILQREWEHKRLKQEEKEENWRRAMVQYEREVESRKHEEHERQEKVRLQWAHERERHVREFEELVSRERRERELERERWRRELEERDRREEEERQKRHMFWGNVDAHTCTTYATREYTAQLMNLPTDWKHRVDACKSTPLEIHGISYLPKTCEDRGRGVVIGRWAINQGEPDCTTFWDSYNDKGCTSPGSGKKYITHKLMNLPEKGDWKEFCATTPAHFNHMQFPGAQECFTSAWGVYGQWEIVDNNC